MTDYTKLVLALRCCIPNPPETCEGCTYNTGGECNVTGMMDDAADAIEELQQIAEHYEQSAKDYWKEACEYKNKWVKSETDATNLTGKLAQAEAEVERLKDSNEELREKQTYIDRYGAEWMTSAKDVPTAAYEHGYADGRDEAETKLPKRGEWKTTDAFPHRVYCSNCFKTYVPNDRWQIWVDKPGEGGLERNYCPSCGAKMEVLE